MHKYITKIYIIAAEEGSRQSYMIMRLRIPLRKEKKVLGFTAGDICLNENSCD